jgi:CRISPR system Cascade subunit CasD
MLEELAALRMGVRVDREGVPQTDFHTAGGRHLLGDSYGVIKADGKSRDTVTSYRHYLADADFLVGLESENDALIRRLDEAVGRPCWQLYLGRKSFVPAVPVQVPNGLLLNVALEDALTAFDWPTDRRSNAPERLRLVLEVSPGDSRATEVRHDVPLSFSHRRFTIRYVMTDYVSRPKGGKSCTSPD